MILKPKNGTSSNINCGLKVAIDASRNRSGGAVAHILGLITEGDPISYGIDEVHVWSHKALLEKLPNKYWLKKHNPQFLEKSIFHQIIWQAWMFKKEFVQAKCDLLLNTDAGTFSKVSPAITMSRDMLSYEKGEMERYRFSLARLRLLLLRFIQNASLRRANGVIFLTHYAAKVIQGSCGSLENVQFIPHGITEHFRQNPKCRRQAPSENEPWVLLYVSNTDLYKHQWHVVAAVELLRSRGQRLILKLVGGGTGRPHKRLLDQLEKSDPNRNFVEVIPFVPHDDIPALHASADIFIFASSCENMPNTLIEAMAAGMPIASSNRGPMPEVLQDAGLYFDPENPLSIATALENLMLDSDLRVSLAYRAEELSKEYSWRKCAEQTWSFIKKTNTMLGSNR